jgi:N-acylneuraminate cytidylyltransferase/CMP-N,N'-diacetyllegionaminic acid synthase
VRVLYLIVARGGSKAIPRKNLERIGDLSLVGFKARSAQRAETCSRLIISTDDQEIRAEALRLDVDAPFVRPAELATDSASTDDVVLHAMQWVETHTDESYDAVMLLEPSSPFATADDYDAAVRLMVERRANVVLGVCETEVNSVFVGPMDLDGRLSSIIDKLVGLRALRRQDQPAEYTMNGALYLLRWNFFREHRARYVDRAGTYAHVMDRNHSLEIDDPVDLEWARFLWERGFINHGQWPASAGYASPSGEPAVNQQVLSGDVRRRI